MPVNGCGVITERPRPPRRQGRRKRQSITTSKLFALPRMPTRNDPRSVKRKKRSRPVRQAECPSPAQCRRVPTKAMTKLSMATGLLSMAVLLVAPESRAAPLEEGSALTQLDPDYVEGKKAIAEQDWGRAIKAFSSAALRDTRNADIQSYLGFAYRKSGQTETAFKHYEKALALDPRHRGAHEYVGEAYLLVNNLAKAEEHLAALERICLLPCDELEDLKEEIKRYRASSPR